MDTRIDSAVEFQTVLGRCDRPALLNGWAVSLATCVISTIFWRFVLGVFSLLQKMKDDEKGISTFTPASCTTQSTPTLLLTEAKQIKARHA
jgi:hypothetical protein